MGAVVREVKEMAIKQRIVNNRNIISKSITTILFSLIMWYGKIEQLNGVPAQHYYFAVRHSFDSGLLILIALLGIFGLYISFSKYHMIRGKLIFLFVGSALWFAYFGLFLYRDLLFPHPPTLQTILILAVSISFWIDLFSGDY